MTGWLQIQALRPSDEGTYRCLARNALGQVEASATLTVLTLGKGALSSELWTPGGWGVLGPFPHHCVCITYSSFSICLQTSSTPQDSPSCNR